MEVPLYCYWPTDYSCFAYLYHTIANNSRIYIIALSPAMRLHIYVQ